MITRGQNAYPSASLGQPWGVRSNRAIYRAHRSVLDETGATIGAYWQGKSRTLSGPHWILISVRENTSCRNPVRSAH